MMKKFLKGLSLAVALTLTAGGVAAQDYVGFWEYGSGYALLGDNNDGSYLYLGTTGRYCVTPGDSYSRMNRILAQNGQNDIYWWVDEWCNDGYVRICIENVRGSVGCSTYVDLGWQR